MQAPWYFKCPCAFEKDAAYFQEHGISRTDVRDVTQHHFKKGYHGMGRVLGFTTVDNCSYCNMTQPTRVYFIDGHEQLMYKCDMCFHLGARFKPEDSGYEGSEGDCVRIARLKVIPQVAAPASQVPSKRSLSSPVQTPSPKKPYGIDWSTKKAESVQDNAKSGVFDMEALTCLVAERS